MMTLIYVQVTALVDRELKHQIKGTVALYRQAFVTKNKRIQIAEVNDVNTCTLRRPTGHASGT